MVKGRAAILLAIGAVEIAAFSAFAPNFATAANAYELARSSAEIGLLAIAATWIIKSGGIDLSAGSVVGLAAVVLGALSERGAPWPAAIAAALAAGALCGALNGALAAYARIPPLVVTLATMALYRGVAEGATGGYAMYSAFDPALLAIGQSYGRFGAPPQLYILAIAFCAGAIFLHATPAGRRLAAIGYGEGAARHAGVRIERALTGAYALSGFASAAAGVLTAAHAGQAKADTGTGYELSAITIAVLGGTAISGGAGTLGGTLLALAVVAILQNGLALAGLPGEFASILLGVVLIGSVLLERVARAERRAAPDGASDSADVDMKNSQVAVLVVATMAAALMIVASNYWLVRSVVEPSLGRGGAPRTPDARKLVVAMMPKNKSDPYFVSCRKGAEEAAAELGVELLWDGPNDTDAAKQNEIVEAWITRGVDVVAASVENRVALSTVLRKARARGIPVVTWDADADPDARDFFINQATPQGIGEALADEAARVAGEKAKIAIVTASLTAANQNAWIEQIRARLAAAHPGVEIAAVRPSDGVRDRALTETKNILRAFPDVKLICTIAAAAVPGSAEAVKQEGSKVKVIGLSVPSLCKQYVHEGVIESIVLWNTMDLGYLAVHAAASLKLGRLHAGSTSAPAGRLGAPAVRGDEVLLGKPFRFDKSNIDRFDF